MLCFEEKIKILDHLKSGMSPARGTDKVDKNTSNIHRIKQGRGFARGGSWKQSPRANYSSVWLSEELITLGLCFCILYDSNISKPFLEYRPTQSY